jgi:hypothetical protein
MFKIAGPFVPVLSLSYCAPHLRLFRAFLKGASAVPARSYGRKWQNFGSVPGNSRYFPDGFSFSPWRLHQFCAWQAFEIAQFLGKKMPGRQMPGASVQGRKDVIVTRPTSNY